MRHLAVILALGLVACYQPQPASEASCAVRCGTAGECPPGMQCAPNGFCFGPEVAGCGAGLDAPPAGSSSDASGGGSDGGGGGGSDGGSGSGTLACYGTHLQVCFASAPTGATTLSASIDTGSDPRCTTPASVTPAIDACFIPAGSIAIQGTVRATGPRPLVLVAAQTITIDGPDVLDLRGDRDERAAGAEINCSTNGINGKSGSPAGGGAGGSYATQGGTGGAGGGNGGGVAAATVQPGYRGGCAGGGGGDANNGNTKGGHGGGGGGAVYLVAGESITVSGMINASGQGGDGGAHGPQGGGIHVDIIGPGGGGPGAGGGGGGAGGLIGLDAPTVTGSGALIANGGGGGAGGSSDNDGGDGSTPDGSTTSPASGATGSGGGGNGGAGYGTTGGTPVQAASASSGGAQNSGGGGGGGGGAIWVYATSKNLTGRVSPNPTP